MKRTQRKGLLCGALAVGLLLALFFVLPTERDAPAALMLLSDAEYERMCAAQAEAQADADAGQLLIAGEPAPFDAESDTYYVPQSMDKAEWDWPLTWSRSGRTACLCPDALLSDKAEAIRSGHAFTLMITDGQEYFRRRIVFTGLPMIALTENSALMPNESVFRMRCFDPSGAADGGYLVTVSNASFRERGMSSRTWPKNSYRMNLFNSGSAGEDVSLLGLRSDDDWILNAMYLDPQRIRDKLCAELWEQLCDGNGVNQPHTHARMTELTVMGEYYGLYCLMEPVGRKSTGLNPETDFLFQFDNWAVIAFAPGERCEIDDLSSIGTMEYRSGNTQSIIRQMESVCAYVNRYLTGADPVLTEGPDSFCDIGNLIDISLFAEASANWDLIEKNMFLLGTRRADGSYGWTLIPWDCDLSFGCGLDGQMSAAYQFRDNRRSELVRLEAADPARFRPLLQARWAELRRTHFSDAALEARIRALVAYNVESGALLREAERWKKAEISAEVEPMLAYMRERLAYLDGVYAALVP